MPTVIDSLVVQLGLDPKNFNANQKKALDDFKKFQEEAAKRAKGIEDQTHSITGSMQDLARSALRTFALFTGGAGVVSFVSGIAQADANVGRLNRNLGISTTVISRWQGVARIFGSTAEGMASSFTTLTDAFAGYKMGVVTPLIGDLRALGAAGGIVIDSNKGIEQTFLDISQALKNIHDQQGPEAAGWWGRRVGLDPGLFDAMLRGRAGMKEVLEYVQKIGSATEKDVNAAQSLQQQWASLLLVMEQGARNSGVIPFATNLLAQERPDAFISHGLIEYIKAVANWGKNGKAGESMPSFSSFFTAPSKPLFSSTEGAFGSLAEKEAFIRAEAARRGIDPDIAMQVAKSEGFNAGKYVGDQGTSFGAFQLHYKNNIPGLSNSGLGDAFTKQTGLDARDPSTERQQIKFALDQAAAGGWGPWHGWHGAPNAGISSGGNISIQNMTINTQATDAAGIARDFQSEVVKRQSAAANANGGQN